MTTPAPLQLYIGDDWTILVPLVDEKGEPVNFTTEQLTPGAEYFQCQSIIPTAGLSVTNGGVTIVDASNGKFTVNIGEVLTNDATPMATGSRIHVFVTDSANRRTTVGVIPITPLNP